MKNKKAIEMGFNWIFAIIAGAFILFIAIYATSKLVDIVTTGINTENAASLGSFMDHLETGLASGKKQSPIIFKKDVIINLECSSELNKPFGEQKISLNKKFLGEKYGNEGYQVPIRDKFIFTENTHEGKIFTFFSKPFFMPYKVSDIIVILSKDYCFFKAPNEIKEELEGLEIPNIHFEEDLRNCSESMVVCFEQNSRGCDVNVIGMCTDSFCESVYDYGKVIRNNKQMYYMGNLLYGAIFSSPSIYECNVKRLMNKFSQLGKVYIDKVSVIQRKGCEPKLQTKLFLMTNYAANLTNSIKLVELKRNADEIDIINNEANSGCRLY